MKIQFLSATRIRRTIKDLSQPTIGVINAGVELEVEDRMFRGEEVDGVNTYFRDAHGWYYWSGRAIIRYKALPAPASTPPDTAEDTHERIGGSWALPTEEPATEAATGTVPPPVSPTTAPAPPPPRPTLADNGPLAGTAHAATSRPTVAPPTPPQRASWHYTPGMHPWGIQTDAVVQQLWQQHQLSGDGVRIGVITTQPLFDTRALAQVREHKNWQRTITGARPTDAATGQLTILTGHAAATWEGLAPNATICLASIDPVGAETAQQLQAALQWLSAQAVDILLINGFWPGTAFALPQMQQLETTLARLTQQTRLLIAPIGEGRGLRPVDNWPAASPFCLAVGAYQRNQQVFSTNQRSGIAHILAPGEHATATAMDGGPTQRAALFTTGIAALLLEYSCRAGRERTAQEWLTLFRKGTDLSAAHLIAQAGNTYGRLTISKLLEELN